MDSVTKKPRALQFCSGHGQVPEPSLARMGGGRPALTSRPSPDPLNGEL